MVWALPTNSFCIVRRVLGVVLLIAAALKGYAVVNVELFCGMWLLTDWLPRWTWRGAVALFSLFAVVSVSKIIAGDASCGCFGRVPVSPWWTLGFDLVAIGALVRARSASYSDVPSTEGPGARRYAIAMPAIALLAIAVPANVLMALYRPSVLANDGVIVGESGIVVLEPEKWVGQPFPLLKYIDIGEQLATGQWRVLLYHHDCPRCQAPLQSWYEDAGREQACVVKDGTSGGRAVVAIPPFSAMRQESSRSLVMGQLAERFDWFVETPLEVVIENGRCVAWSH